jgi:hypothetical protein
VIAVIKSALKGYEEKALKEFYFLKAFITKNSSNFSSNIRKVNNVTQSTRSTKFHPSINKFLSQKNIQMSV